MDGLLVWIVVNQWRRETDPSQCICICVFVFLYLYLCICEFVFVYLGIVVNQWRRETDPSQWPHHPLQPHSSESSPCALVCAYQVLTFLTCAYPPHTPIQCTFSAPAESPCDPLQKEGLCNFLKLLHILYSVTDND